MQILRAILSTYPYSTMVMPATWPRRYDDARYELSLRLVPSVHAHARRANTRGERAVLAEVRLIRLKQPLDDFAADEVLFDDLGDVIDGYVTVPDLLGVDDDAHPVRALVEAAGVVRTDDLVDAAS